MVRQLGSPTFRLREQAERRLAELDKAAIPALRAGLQNGDDEVRNRCRRLLARAERGDLARQLDALLSGQANPAVPPPASWERFRKLAGDDADARTLYVELFRDNAALMELLDRDPKKAGGELPGIIRQLHRRTGIVRSKSEPVRLDEVSLMLFAALDTRAQLDDAEMTLESLMDEKLPKEGFRRRPAARRLAGAFLDRQPGMDFDTLREKLDVAEHVGLTEYIDQTLKPRARALLTAYGPFQNDPAVLLNYARFAQSLQLTDTADKSLKPPARRLVAAAARQAPRNPGELMTCIQLARVLDLKEGVDLGLALLKRPEPTLRGQGAYLIGRSGGPQQLADLAPLLEDTAGVEAGTVSNRLLSAQVRDVALASSVRLSGEKLADYGFAVADAFQSPDPTDPELFRLGFPDDPARAAALKKWKDGAAKRKSGG
jgi:hypothetical protein